MVDKGFKNTEIGVIPENWEVVKLFRYAQLINGRAYSLHEWENSGVPVIRLQNLTGNSENYYYSNIKLPEKNYCDYGDLLFMWSATFGPIIWRKSRAIFHYHIWKIETNAEFLNRSYLYYKLEEITESLKRSSSNGGTMLHITKGFMDLLPIPLPPIPEQQAIAGALSDVDEWIDNLEKLIVKKYLIKQGAMQQLFMPKEDWEVKKLGEIAEVRDGTHQTPTYVESGIPFYSVESITRNDFSNTKFISEEAHKQLTKTFRIEKGDILMTRIGSIGDCKLIDWDVNASFYVSLALLKIKTGFSASYIYHYSKSENFRREADINSLQSAVPKKINLGPISNIKIEFPLIEEQMRIASILSDMEAEIEILENQLKKACQIKQGMMQELLAGKVRLV